MENNDYFFYIIVAASVVGSIVKALKKKPEENQTEAKPSVGGDILKKLLEEMRDKDDYIPRNPVPAPAAKPEAKQSVTNPSARTSSAVFDRKGKVEKGYVVPSTSKNNMFQPEEEYVDPFIASIDLSSPEEMKKAIIYSEIFRTKF